MLTPKKHLDLDSSVIRVAAFVLLELKRRRVVELEKLRAYSVRRAGENADVSFIPSLSFLFLLGRLAYHPQNDTVEYLTG